MTIYQQQIEDSFNAVVDALLQQLQDQEHLTIGLIAEDSHFVRFNRGRVRQNGLVKDGNLKLTLLRDQRELALSLPFTGEREIDLPLAIDYLQQLQQEVNQVPPNPYAVMPLDGESSYAVYSGELLPPDRVAEQILSPIQGLDFVGFYAGGMVIRATANSKGQKHWFATETFLIDYSLYQGEQAVKGIYSDRTWHQSTYQQKIARDRAGLEILTQTAKTIPRGSYRVYFAPSAVASLLATIEGEFSAAKLHQRTSALVNLWQGHKYLSSRLTLGENYRSGVVPRFNEGGELAPLNLPVLVEGKLVNTIVNRRSAAEYAATANGGNRYESLRAPEISPGDLPPDQVLSALDRGIYLSDLHYLNWSDRPTGRITGMTRFACFWVEEGKPVAPIAPMRFDDSLYNFWGEHLCALTTDREFIPETSTYEHRSIGGRLVPGMIVDNFTFTI